MHMSNNDTVYAGIGTIGIALYMCCAVQDDTIGMEVSQFVSQIERCLDGRKLCKSTRAVIDDRTLNMDLCICVFVYIGCVYLFG